MYKYYTMPTFPHCHSVILPFHLLWNVQLWVIGLVGQTTEYDGLLTNQIEGVAETRTGGVAKRSETSPLPAAGQQLIELGGEGGREMDRGEVEMEEELKGERRRCLHHWSTSQTPPFLRR